MLRIALIGTGNLAVHLAAAFEQLPQLDFVQWIGRATQAPKRKRNTPYFNEFQKNIPTDICIVAVSDDEISRLANKLKNIDMCVVHTSGAVALAALKSCPRQGVLYPLQSFVKNEVVDWTNIPICIEANNSIDLKKLETCAKALSASVHKATSKTRAKLHLAAVFANNFTNHMVHISQELCAQHNLPAAMLDELLKTTFIRATVAPASKVQTGPAKRNDVATMEQHLSQLDQGKKDIYTAISNDIYNTHSL